MHSLLSVWHRSSRRCHWPAPLRWGSLRVGRTTRFLLAGGCCFLIEFKMEGAKPRTLQSTRLKNWAPMAIGFTWFRQSRKEYAQCSKVSHEAGQSLGQSPTLRKAGTSLRSGLLTRGTRFKDRVDLRKTGGLYPLGRQAASQALIARSPVTRDSCELVQIVIQYRGEAQDTP